MKAEMIAVGSEILLGDIQNTHAQYLSKKLAELGIDMLFHTAVGDNPARLTEVVQTALRRSNLILISGGLGPTKDDVTKRVVCEALNLPLILDPDIQRSIEEYFAHMDREMPENNLQQAYRPETAIVLENQNGTAPGLIIDQEGSLVVLLPGPPGELIPLFEQKVHPFLAEKMGQIILSHNLHIFDMGESKVDHLLSDLMEGSNPTLGIYAKDGEVRARVTAKAESAQRCEAMLSPIIREIQDRLSGYVYGIDIGSLENALVQKALAQKKTIALAESCTGGMVAQRITSVGGASGCFSYGIVSYSNSVKETELGVDPSALRKYGAVSQQVAASMAQQARKKGGADVGIGITGIAGPSGGSREKPVGLVYIGVSTEKETSVKEYHFARGLQNERDAIRNRVCMQALDLARRAIDSLS